LRWVSEYRGDNSAEGGYIPDAVTTYTYNALDLLTQVQDAHGNLTTMSYDSLGRKTQMRDPDMGTWSYAYDVNGNLTRQTDAKNQTLTFGYDALNRLTSKTYPDGTQAVYHYDESVVSNGKGRRTLISIPGAATYFYYDARGNTTGRTYYRAGMSGPQVFQWQYDSADRVTRLTYLSGEVVSYTYDAGWRPTSLCSSLGGCYVTNASYSALDQPQQWTYGNSVAQTWTYASPMARLTQLTIGAAFTRQYGYDAGGNVRTISDPQNANTNQTFGYDHRDRLTAWSLGSTSQSYQYDRIGNLTTKAGVSYQYGAALNGTGAGPHQARTVGGQSYTYDANGNLLSGGGRTYTWNADNLPIQISQVNGSESYTYDADGERVTRTVGSTTTMYFGGLWEQDLGGAARTFYTFNGQVVAQRSGSTVTYLHGDHLGSIGVATNQSGQAMVQEFDPWGKVRSGGITQTTLNYTGQRLDATGLLYYHARYYDPGVGRFVSADSVVPGNASGGMDGVALKPLTVDYHEPGFASSIGTENQQPFWFEMSGEQRQQAGRPWGPANPQALNRYSYVQNNPLKYVDPSGHTWYLSQDDAVIAAGMLRDAASELRGQQLMPSMIDSIVAGIIGTIAVRWLEKVAEKAVSGALLRGAASLIGNIAATVTFMATIWDEGLGFQADQLDEMASLIEKANIGGVGVALKYEDGALWSLNRSDGSLYTLKLPPLTGNRLPGTLVPGLAKVYGDFNSGLIFASDCRSLQNQGMARCR
jgi:RHS repeat-associated protein